MIGFHQSSVTDKNRQILGKGIIVFDNILIIFCE